MRFAFIADVPGWALHRQGMGLVKYGGVDGHTWDLYHVAPTMDFDKDILEGYDAVRIGAGPLLRTALDNGWLPSLPEIIVSLASFRDEEIARSSLRLVSNVLSGIVTVDQRLLVGAAYHRCPSFWLADGTDHEVFYPEPELCPTYGPLRVGWAGSISSWPGIKHPGRIEKACKVAGMEFVRQDRELDGLKDEDEMRRWFNSLDVYCVANEEDTPTPVPWLEAAACGVAVMGTRCGDLWPVNSRAATIEGTTQKQITDTMKDVRLIGRFGLHSLGRAFRDKYLMTHLSWDTTRTREFTRFVAAICEGA